MGLVTCKDCKNQVSSSAEKCPQCGRPLNKPGAIGKIFAFLIGAPVGLWGLVVLMDGNIIGGSVLAGIGIGMMKVASK